MKRAAFHLLLDRMLAQLDEPVKMSVSGLHQSVADYEIPAGYRWLHDHRHHPLLFQWGQSDALGAASFHLELPFLYSVQAIGEHDEDPLTLNSGYLGCFFSLPHTYWIALGGTTQYAGKALPAATPNYPRHPFQHGSDPLPAPGQAPAPFLRPVPPGETPPWTPPGSGRGTDWYQD